MSKLKLVLIGASLLSGGAFAATPSAPSLKPGIVYGSSVVEAEDAPIFHEALQASKDKNWSRLRTHYANAQNSDVSDFILWRLATGAGESAGFDILNTALERLEEYPRRRAIRNSAESAIGSSALSMSERVEWFEANDGAISGQGKAAYAEALSATGQPEKAIEVAREAWRGSTLKRATERQILAKYGSDLDGNDHEARANFLLWGGRSYTAAAARLKPKLSASYRKLVDARIALISRRGSGVDAKIAAVPSSLKNDPGLMYDRARWRRQRARNQSGATSLLVQIDGANVPINGRDNLWDERNIAVRAILLPLNGPLAGWRCSYLMMLNVPRRILSVCVKGFPLRSACHALIIGMAVR